MSKLVTIHILISHFRKALCEPHLSLYNSGKLGFILHMGQVNKPTLGTTQNYVEIIEFNLKWSRCVYLSRLKIDLHLSY